MEQSMKRRGIAVATVVALALICTAFVADEALADEAPTACETVSLAFAQKTVGLSHAKLLRDHSNLGETSGEGTPGTPNGVHSECDVGLWSGKAPQGPAASAEKARARQAAQVGVDAWAPNSDSPDVKEWEEREFGEVTAGLLKGRFKFLQISGTAKRLNPEGVGYSGAGLTVKGSGIAHGLEAAAGCWWDVGTYRANCLFTEEAAGKPVVAHLNALAKKIVPNFLGAP